MSTKTRVKFRKTNSRKGSLTSKARKPELSSTKNSPVDEVLNLQRTAGNKTVQGLFRSGAIQPKLRIGETGDKYELEADRMAEQVMRMPDSVCPGCMEKKEEESIQPKVEGSNTTEMSSDVESGIGSLKGGGQPLSESVRNYFEPRFRYDFSGVRVHTGVEANETAKSINARAFTLGKDIVLGTNDYSPETGEGKKLLAHELTHVVQQHCIADKNISLVQRSVVPDLKTYEPLLALGSVGYAVIIIQESLNQAGAHPPLVVDGIFGPQTQRAVLAFQSARGLEADGVVGPDTKSALFGGGSGGSCLRECNYEPGEPEASAISPGEVQFGGFSSDPFITKILFWDFQAGKSDIKKGHKYGAKAMVMAYHLGEKDPPNEIVEIVGFTDCVASEEINRPIRKQRAQNVRQELYLMGAREENLITAEAASPCAAMVDNSTREGRAKNRSTLIVLLRRRITKIPPEAPRPETPTPEPKPKPVCGLYTDIPSTHWGLKSIGGVRIVAGKGLVEADFILRNDWSQCKYFAKFRGIALGLSISGGISLFSDFERLEVNSRKLPGEMDSINDTSAKLTVIHVSFPPVPLGHTRMYLWPANDNVSWVRFKGTALSIGLIPVGGLKSDGRFTVVDQIP